jgi:hypothetical protein
MSSAAMLAMM